MSLFLRTVCLFLCVLMLLPLYGCGYKVQSVDIALTEGGEAKLYIQLPEDAAKEILYARDRLVFYVQEKTGATLASGTEAPADGTPYLTLGNVGDEAYATLAEELEGDQFLIRAAGNRITVAASNDAFLFDAVGYLIEKMTLEGGTLRLSGVIDTATAGNTSTLMYMFTQSKTVAAESEYQSKLSFLPGADGELGTNDDIMGTQGGCRVGKYHYQAIIKTDKESNEMNNITYVVKYDLETKETVMCSELLQLNHANDMTYNAKTNELVIVHHGPRTKMLSFMDPETLTVTRTAQLPVSVYSIAYDKVRDMYVVGVAGGQNMRRITADFQYADGRTIWATESAKHYTTQGIACDEYFIYCVLYDSMHAGATNMQNIITVYDWYGNFVGTINAKVGNIEPENISVVDGKIFVLAHKSRTGGMIYEVTPTAPVAEKEK